MDDVYVVIHAGQVKSQFTIRNEAATAANELVKELEAETKRTERALAAKRAKLVVKRRPSDTVAYIPLKSATGETFDVHLDDEDWKDVQAKTPGLNSRGTTGSRFVCIMAQRSFFLGGSSPPTSTPRWSTTSPAIFTITDTISLFNMSKSSSCPATPPALAC